jgi:hypothetical protein
VPPSSSWNGPGASTPPWFSSPQTWASLGPDDTIRNRLAGTVGTVIVHQLKQPDEVAALAGTEWVLQRTEQTRTLDHTGLGSQRAGNRYVVHPDDIRRLHEGEAFIIHRGHALKLHVRLPGARHERRTRPSGFRTLDFQVS